MLVFLFLIIYTKATQNKETVNYLPSSPFLQGSEYFGV